MQKTKFNKLMTVSEKFPVFRFMPTFVKDCVNI